MVSTRRIWLCADDYGMAPGVNAAIRDLVGKGRLNAVSAMTVSPNLDQGSADALGALNVVRHSAAIGLHVTLTTPYRPLTAAFAPTRNGAFPSLGEMFAHAMLRRFDASALRAEVAAQFERFAALFGRPPDFVDGHQHVHLLPQVRDVVLEQARHHAPQAWVRQCGRVASKRNPLGDPKGALLDVLSATFRRRARALGITTNAAFAGTYVFADTADYAALFPRFLDGLPDGSLVMCHPGTVDRELERLDPVTHLREREYAYLASDAFPRALTEAGVTLR